MTSEEMNRTIEFLVENAAHFSTQMEQMRQSEKEVAARHDRDHEVLFRRLNDLRESTVRFQAWATEVIAIESSRLDQNDKRLKQHDQLHQDALDFQRQALHLLHRILDKL